GQDTTEEIDFLPAGTGGGVNFGWSDVEGTRPFNAGGPPAGAMPPIYEYDHSGGRCSVTGGFVYRGRAIPSLSGTYLFGDNCDCRNGLAQIPGGPRKDTLPAWRITDPAPEAELMSDYREAESQFGVGWNYLASINLIESALGRIQGLSAAGAQGPMQFMPST